jgi:hypothetical protein
MCPNENTSYNFCGCTQDDCLRSTIYALVFLLREGNEQVKLKQVVAQVARLNP